MHKKLAWLFAIVFLVLGLFPGVVGAVEIGGADRWVYLITGIWGLLVALGKSGATTYFKVVGIVYAILTVWGLAAPDSVPVVSIGGSDNWLHLVTAALALWAGYKK